DVQHGIHYSRHHMVSKRGKAPRPKFHCIMPIARITDHEEYKRLSRRAQQVFPFFDTRAEDAAHFFFGTKESQVDFFPGTVTLNEYLDLYYPEDDPLDDVGSSFSDTIPEGSRNSTLSHFAGRVLKRFGDSEEAFCAFMEPSGTRLPV
ncbi:MAG: DNA primase, partial [Eubacteriales bacterium]|nr:DNA primase [Eubacteriales bacterium]